MRVSFWGTGTSVGIPMIGCSCGTCVSDDVRDQRTRASIMIEFDGHSVLVDTSTDFRIQALRCRLHKLDAIFYTHAHADHIFGLDDIRPLNIKHGPIPCFCTPETLERLKEIFSYAFVDRKSYGGLPWVTPHLFDGEFEFAGQRFLPLKTLHGEGITTAYRFDGVAYLTDCSAIPAKTLDALWDLDVLILDALRLKPHPTHLTLEQALAYVEVLRPRRTYLTHISHEIRHEEISRGLPPGVELAYDGLQFEI
ncbi:MAG: MBL fold metallo-hydrolase [Acidobacteria bacterium]|nr:MBL fold metallo-hydrolase [Acidobacteriota bacterium]